MHRDNPVYLLDLNDEKVKGAIQLILFADGRITFSTTGIFKSSPQLLDRLADMLESIQRDKQADVLPGETCPPQ